MNPLDNGRVWQSPSSVFRSFHRLTFDSLISWRNAGFRVIDGDFEEDDIRGLLGNFNLLQSASDPARTGPEPSPSIDVERRDERIVVLLDFPADATCSGKSP
jgi:HSP20 family molecular chaperone IbpA